MARLTARLPPKRAGRVRMPCVSALFALFASSMWPVAAQDLHYDAQIAWFHAGTISMTLAEAEDRYELSGVVTTSGAMNRLFKWRGQFAATGRLVDGFPITRAYLLLEYDGETREVLLAFGDKTTTHATDAESKELPVPPGSDLMSVMFLAPHCLGETTVHDGEDAYRIVPERTTPRNLNQRSGYFSGPTMRCDYRFRYVDGSTRHASVWMAEQQDMRFPVRIQVRVPFFPDGILRLRVEKPSGQPSHRGSGS